MKMNYKPIYLAIAVVLMTCTMQVTQAKFTKRWDPEVAAIQLASETLNDVKRWWNNEISGEVCARHFTKNTIGSGGFIAGSYIGAEIAEHFFSWIPGSSVIAKIAGGYLGKKMTHYLIDSLANNSPKDEVLEEAYEFFDLKENASIYEINQSFNRLANQFKLGTDDFQKLQFYMSVIQLSKGESLYL